MSSTWEISELLSIMGSILGSFIFMYTEIKAMKLEMKSDFSEMRDIRKVELEQCKQEIMINISDSKQSFKNELNTFRIDLANHRKDLKEELIIIRSDAKLDMKEMQAQIIELNTKIATLTGMLSSIIPPNQKI